MGACTLPWRQELWKFRWVAECPCGVVLEVTEAEVMSLPQGMLPSHLATVERKHLDACLVYHLAQGRQRARPGEVEHGQLLEERLVELLALNDVRSFRLSPSDFAALLAQCARRAKLLGYPALPPDTVEIKLAGIQVRAWDGVSDGAVWVEHADGPSTLVNLCEGA